MFCPKCGTNNNDSSAFCIKCGNNLQEVKVSATPAMDDLGEQGTVQERQRVFTEGESFTERYRIEKYLGEGGMGIVYKALDEKLNRPVAIKLLPREMSLDARNVRRFQREAQAVAQLNHPNIVHVFDFDQFEDIYFITMEYVDGVTLLDVIAENAPMSVDDMLKYAAPICRGLHHAHDNQIYHRDIKPSNIMLTSMDEVKITDFGIARIVKDTSMRSRGAQDTSGTLAYMSPEQLRGKKVDARSDIYSLGIVLYEMLAGDTPFTTGDITYQHLNEEPAAIEVDRSEVNAIVMKCLAKAPEDRFQTAAEMQEALEGWEEDVVIDPVAKVAATYRDQSEQSVWVNVDRPNKDCTIHTNPECKWWPSEEQGEYKPIVKTPPSPPPGISPRKTDGYGRDGGWVEFNGESDAMEYCRSLEGLRDQKPYKTKRCSECEKRNAGMREHADARGIAPPDPKSSQPVLLEHIAGKDGAEMALIPAGEFEMGSDDGKDNEKPAHRVYLDTFYMDVYPVTNAQYKKFVDSAPDWRKDGIDRKYHDGDYLKAWNGDSYPSGQGDRPVVYVSWHSANAYAEWAGKRLPTEAEWEKAGRGGLTGKKYPWGDDITNKNANYSSGGTTQVGSYPVNGYGLYDMAGNVWDWCCDWYGVDYYSKSPSQNPIGPSSGNARVLRGGSWNLNTYYLRVASRHHYNPSYTYDYVGFRCVSQD